MKHTLRYGFLALLIILNITNIFCQGSTDIAQLTSKDFLNIQLPPLNSLFENAKNGPIYSLAETKVLIQKKILFREKKAFLGFFSIRGSYQYGMFGNEATYKDRTVVPYRT